METKQTVGHMTHFLKERDDWKFIYDTVCEIRHSSLLSHSLTPKSLEKAVSMSHYYAHRQYPIYQMHPFPTSFQATDSVIIWREAGKILLGRKKGKKLWRLPGGFVDPKDTNLEKASERERSEECHIGFEDADLCLCSHPKYIGSCRVPDPRYENSPDKIMSAVFISYYIDGTPKAGDDLVEVKWFTKDYVRRCYPKMVEPVHHPLMSMLINRGYL